MNTPKGPEVRFGWKIVRRGPAGHWRTLYKGLHGRRNLPLNSWLVAERKIAREGSGHRYTTGWHVLPEDAAGVVAKYLKRFTSTDDLDLAAVAYSGGEKKPGRTSVWLAEYLFVTGIRLPWDKAVAMSDEDRQVLLESTQGVRL
jgi:hypothetical protein